MTAVTRPSKVQPAQVGALILTEKNRTRLEPMLPKGDKLERIAQIVMLEARRNPSLLECEPMSIVDSVSRILAWGLEVGETAYLVPFSGKCQPVKGYQGIIQLMYDSGHVRGVNAFVVREGDVFSYEYGLDPELKHVPAAKRGAMTHAYCVIRLPFQHREFRVMTFEEVEAIRQQYSKQWKKGPMPEWYMLKTVIIHTAKLLPKNSKFAAIHEAVRREETEEAAELDVPEVDATLERPAHVDADGVDLSYETDEDLLAQDREIAERDG